MANSFYNEYGELVADVEDNNDDILEKLLYQGVTRARDKLCIIVLDNKEVFEKLLEMKSGINREYNRLINRHEAFLLE